MLPLFPSLRFLINFSWLKIVCLYFSLENPLKAEAIIEVLQLDLPRTGLKLGNSYSDVRVMSGRDEGIYAFITVNYLLGKFGDVSWPCLKLISIQVFNASILHIFLLSHQNLIDTIYVNEPADVIIFECSSVFYFIFLNTLIISN